MLKDLIIFAHEFTGTDTTSSASRRGEAQACHPLRKKTDFRAEIAILYNNDVSQKEIAAAGERLFFARYDVEKLPSLLYFFFQTQAND